VNEAKTNEEILELIQSNNMIDSLLRSGWVNSVTLSNRDIALQNLIIHEVLVKRKEALDQFCKGLQALGVHSAIQTCPEAMKVYFVAQQTPLSVTAILDLFADINAVQECSRCEKARGFFIDCIRSLETCMYWLNSIYCIVKTWKYQMIKFKFQTIEYIIQTYKLYTFIITYFPLTFQMKVKLV
jgi:hypothetical protein